MAYSIVIYATRKPGTSPSQFKTHYEKNHVPLIRSLAGDKFPLSHTRHYIARTPGENATNDPTNSGHPALTFAGTQPDFDYDAFAILTWENEAKFQEFFGIVSAPENAAKIASDEEAFLDRTKLKIAAVDQTSSTARPGMPA